MHDSTAVATCVTAVAAVSVGAVSYMQVSQLLPLTVVEYSTVLNYLCGKTPKINSLYHSGSIPAKNKAFLNSHNFVSKSCQRSNLRHFARANFARGAISNVWANRNFEAP